MVTVRVRAPYVFFINYARPTVLPFLSVSYRCIFSCFYQTLPPFSLVVSFSSCLYICLSFHVTPPAVLLSFLLSVAVFDFGCLHLGSNWTGAAPGKISPLSLCAILAARHYPNQLGFSLFLSLFSSPFEFLLNVFKNFKTTRTHSKHHKRT